MAAIREWWQRATKCVGVRRGEVTVASAAAPNSGHSSAAERWQCRLLRIAPLLLAASVLIRFAASVLQYGDLYIDLRVYVVGGAAVGRPGTLYDAFSLDGVGQHLPFTYPPFAAILYYPLHWFPFAIVAFAWTAATIAALYGVVRISQMMAGSDNPRAAMLWTGAAILFEPVRSTLDLGQVNMFLMLAVLYAARSSRWWVSGSLVGLAAGVKLTPAIASFYLLGMRRWTAAAASIVAFVATIGVSAVLLPRETRLYFTELLGDVQRVGAVDYAPNQSWQGTLSRIVGYDVGRGPLLLLAIFATAILAAFAWRALGGRFQIRDALGSLLVIQLFGLTISPVSWTHHWVWVVPLVVWLFHGRWCDAPGVKVLRWLWVALLLIGVPTLLALQPQDYSRPWYFAWADAVYVPMTLATFAWMIVAGRQGAKQDGDRRAIRAGER
ncbi:mannosyltransferase [Mycobacterium yunnanensis]|uniref:Mannosyltransferase n=1 Tax=Mycobacterium yunnanensis TaxID=368477 RepID=A0A9X2Z106_9MYCO|nr:mannosyltransferase [Mycobacterium yunnanensis]